MTLHPDVEALIQGALDDTLRPEERERLDRLMTESVEARGRLAHLQELTRLLESIGPAEPPASLVPDVLAQISRNAGSALDSSAEGSFNRVAAFQQRTPAPRPIAFGRRFAVSWTIVFGLAAAAVLVLAFATFRGYPPASEGTAATIGVAPGTRSQALLQTDTWEQIARDEAVRALLQDADFRVKLEDAALRLALSDADILQALQSPSFIRKLNDQRFVLSLNDVDLLKRFDDPELQTAMRSPALMDAFQSPEFRARLADASMVAALAGPAFQKALHDRAFAEALRNPALGEALASGTSRCPEALCGAAGSLR